MKKKIIEEMEKMEERIQEKIDEFFPWFIGITIIYFIYQFVIR